MRSSTSPHPASAAALASLLLLTVWAPASAEDVRWNQERVTSLARDLDGPLEAFRADLQAHPAPPGKEAARTAAMEAVERLQSKARELAHRFAGGAGRDDTLALFHELKAVQRQAAKSSRGYAPAFDMHRYVDKIDHTINELAQYYGEYQAPGEWSND